MGRGDLELARAVSEGNKQAAAELAGRLYERVRTACRYLGGAGEDWEDMVQVVMMEILRSAGSYTGKASLEKWANTIIMRSAWKGFRKRERYRGIIVSLHRSSAKTSEVRAGGAEVEVDGRLARGRIAGCLDKMNYDQRTCLVMKFVFDFSVKEIAGLTGSPENTVKDRLKKGKEKLRLLVMEDEVLTEYLRGIKG